MALSDFETYLRSTQKSVDLDNAVVEKRLAWMYRDSYKEANAELAKLYANLGKTIDIVEARKYMRLEGLLAEIAKEYKKLTGKALTMAIDTGAQNFAGASYGYKWAMDQALGMTIGWTVMPVDAIRASVYSEYSGLNIIKTFKKNTVQELSKIQAAITRGIATGSGYVKTAEGLKSSFENGFNDALRVVRTEAGRNYTEGNLHAHDEAIKKGIDVVKIWDATLDMRTRPAHGALDGTEADKEGNFNDSLGGHGPGPHLMGVAGSDINCRCRLNSIIRGLSPELRRIKGEKEPVPYVSWETWAASKGWTPEKGWPKVKIL
jgi:hypothetical protein